MLAIYTMDPTLVFVFLLLAVICFALAALGVVTRVVLGWLGLVFFAIPPMWNAAVVAQFQDGDDMPIPGS
jgi:hypothetical protein